MSNISEAPARFTAEEQAQHSRPAYCYAVQLDDGTTLFFTGRDRTITIAGLPAELGAADPQTFTPAQITHGTISTSDRFDGQPTTIQVTSENTRLARYLLTAGTVKLRAWIIRIAAEALHESTADFSTQAVIVQSGIVGKFGIQGNVIAMELTPEPFFVEAQIPRFYFGRQCQHFLYGEQVAGVGCGLNKEDWKFESFIKTLDRAQRSIRINSQPPPPAAETYFNAGHLVIPSLGLTMFVAWSAWIEEDVTLKLATWHPELAADQTLTVYAGCRRTKAACEAFGNLANFGGFPDVPNKSPLQGIQ